jgi:UDP-glucuronate 4-epimerase
MRSKDCKQVTIMRVLVTGVAGFIGYHVSERLLLRGDSVIGVDNLDPSGDVSLKYARLEKLRDSSGFSFHLADVRNIVSLQAIFEREVPERVVHLAARVGVRATPDQAREYTDTNVTGFLHVLECCRAAEVEHLVFASSSSVYGANTELPFSEHAPVDQPQSFYGMTKLANELMARTYSSLYWMPISGLRIFTAYGPWGRPDMAPMLFLRAIEECRVIDLYGDGRLRRDFTYIDDVGEALVRVLDRLPEGTSPYRLLNVGRGEPVELIRFVALLEERLGIKARINLLPALPRELETTWAHVQALSHEIGFYPQVSLENGLTKLVDWHRRYTAHF